MADFGSGQGLSVFATTGIVCLFRGLQKSENAALGQKMLFPKQQRKEESTMAKKKDKKDEVKKKAKKKAKKGKKKAKKGKKKK
jgi:hypothetical protein